MKSFFCNKLYLLPLIVFAVMFGVNVASLPSLSDDILYEYYYPKHPMPDAPHGVVKEHPISSIQDITVSIYHHYFYVNGRAPVHFAVQLFCGLWGMVPFGVCSALFLILFSLFCFKIAGCDDLAGGRWLLLAPVFLLLLFFIEPNAWMGIAGGINYLWSSVFCLCFWWYFTKHKDVKSFEMVMFCLLSFLAGWSHEGIVIPLSIACMSFYFRNVRTFKKSQYAMIVCWGVGAAFLVFAPANFIRAGESIGWTIKSIINLFRLMRCFFVMCVLWMVLLVKSKSEAVSFVRNNMDVLVGIFGGIVFFSFIQSKPPRTAYGIELLSVILSCKLIMCLLEKENAQRFVGICVSCIALLGMGSWVYYQQRSNEQIEDLFSQFEDTTKKNGVYIVKDTDCPRVLYDYLVRCVNYSNPLYDEWGKEVLSWEYERPIVCIVEAKDKPQKIPGNNDLYSWGNYWLSGNGFPKEFNIKYHINYNVNLKYRLIRIVKRLLNQDIAVSKERVCLIEDKCVKCSDGVCYTPMYLSKAHIIEEVNLIDNSITRP